MEQQQDIFILSIKLELGKYFHSCLKKNLNKIKVAYYNRNYLISQLAQS